MKILVATDLSEHGKVATDLAHSTEWLPGTVLRLLVVVEPVVGALPLDEVIERGRRALALVARGLERPHVVIEQTVSVGRPADAIIAEVRAYGADLIVVGSRGRGPIATAVLGSVAAEVVDRAPCPVLVARRQAINAVVLAEDGSDAAAGAVALLTALPIRMPAAGIPAHVVAVVAGATPWVIATGMEDGASPAFYETYAAAMEEDHERLKKQVLLTGRTLANAGFRVTTALREGSPASEIIAASDEADGDLIVIGSRGATGLERVVLGSVARSVLTHAKCSVLVVHPRLAVR